MNTNPPNRCPNCQGLGIIKVNLGSDVCAEMKCNACSGEGTQSKALANLLAGEDTASNWKFELESVESRARRFGLAVKPQSPDTP